MSDPISANCLIIAENERRSAAQRLHDQAIQTLLQMNMQIGICKQFFELGHLEETASELNELENQVNLVSKQLRNLMADLRLPQSEDGLFKSMLQTLLETHHQRGGPIVHCKYAIASNIPELTEIVLLRVIQQGLANIRMHAQASKVTLTIAEKDGWLYFNLTDDGVGFAERPTCEPTAKATKTGLITMEIRVDQVQGKLKIDSQPHQGTTLKGALPLWELPVLFLPY